MSLWRSLSICASVSPRPPIDFEGDLRAMAELAEAQPGYLWSDMGPSMVEPSVYVVVSEWYGIDYVRA